MILMKNGFKGSVVAFFGFQLYLKPNKPSASISKTLLTMLQKLSKCEVKAWLFWNLIIFPPLRFCVKSHFAKFKRSKYFIYSNFRDTELWILVNLGLESCSNLQKSKFRTSKIGKNNIFGPFEFAKIRFHVTSEWR